MTFKNILVPTDGSEYTKAAINNAVEMAKNYGAKITALYVIDQTVFVNMPLDSAVMNTYTLLKKEGESAVQYVLNLCKENGVECDIKIVEGSPVECIVEASKDFDIIVMGTLGRTGFSKLMMGSVAERVVRYSECPVMVVRSKEGEKK